MNLTKEDVELFNKIEAGLKLAIKRLYEKKYANNESAVICVNGEIKRISGKDLLSDDKS